MSENEKTNVKITNTNDFYSLFTVENIRISNFDSPVIKTKITNFAKVDRDASFYDFVN